MRPQHLTASSSRLAPFSKWLLSILLFVLPILLYAQRPRPPVRAVPRTLIIDTDAAGDDLMAIAFLLSRPDIRIDAITIANGTAHVVPGGRNVLRLLELAGRRDIPVFLGRETPLSGGVEFPAEWRRAADELSGVSLPEPTREPASQPAAEYLARRLSDAARPVQVLALGPLTNLGEAFSNAPRAARIVRQIVIMGGAVRIPGNLGDGGYFKTQNTTAEWNVFADPSAAKIVLTCGVPLRLIPLDATQRVPIQMALLEQFESHGKTPLARFVGQVLAANRDSIKQGIYFAWDPLAAVALVHPTVASFRPLSIGISDKPEELGRTLEMPRQRANALVALDADAEQFRTVFLSAFGVR